MKIIRQFFSFLKKWLWTKPVSEPPKPKAAQVKNDYICIKYHDQWINLRRGEIQAWNKMSRKDRRGMAHRFSMLEKKKKIKFVEIEGKTTCIKNLDYGNRGQ